MSPYSVLRHKYHVHLLILNVHDRRCKTAACQRKSPFFFYQWHNCTRAPSTGLLHLERMFLNFNIRKKVITRKTIIQCMIRRSTGVQIEPGLWFEPHIAPRLRCTSNSSGQYRNQFCGVYIVASWWFLTPIRA